MIPLASEPCNGKIANISDTCMQRRGGGNVYKCDGSFAGQLVPKDQGEKPLLSSSGTAEKRAHRPCTFSSVRGSFLDARSKFIHARRNSPWTCDPARNCFENDDISSPAKFLQENILFALRNRGKRKFRFLAFGGTSFINP